jgi:predicted ATPase
MSTRRAIGAMPPADAFIGRGAERERLRQALRRSETGRGQLVLLTGAAGIGKTRLALDIAEEAARQARPVLWGRCLEGPGAPPYWPWVQVLRGLPAVPGGPAALGALGAPSAALLADIAPSLFAQGAAPQRRHTDAPTDRFQLFDAVAQLLYQVARHEPLVLMLEDLHWADTTSLRLLAFVASGMVDTQLFMVGSCRDAELTRAHPLSETFAELERMPAFSRLPLAGFSTAETGQYLSVTTGCETTAAVASAVHARTEGHPLFLRETLRWVMGSRTRLSSWTEADTAALGRMPPGVRDVIGKRLNGLSPRAVRLLSMAACIGRDFDVRLLSAIEAETDNDEVLSVLAESLAARLVEATDDPQRLRFSHALVRETLYDDMLPMRRLKVHRRIGEWLEATHADAIAAWLPQLAYHFGESADDAGQAARAMAYAERAAVQSAQLLAYEEAAKFYQLALRLERDCGAPDAGRRCELLLGLGDVLVRVGAGDPSLPAWQEAAALARESGSGAALVRAALGASWGTTLAARRADQAMPLLTQALQLPGLEARLRVELLARLCRAHVHCDQRAAADAAQSQALALATELGDARCLFLALACITTSMYWPERLTARVAAGTRAHALAIADDTIERWALVRH